MSDGNNANACNSLTAFVLGAIVGGGIALLYSPHSGKETRELLANRTNDMKDKAGAAIDLAKNEIHVKREQLAAAVEAGIQAIHTQREKADEESRDHASNA